MPTTKNSGNNSRENENIRKTGSQSTSSSNSDRNRDTRTGNEKQGGNMPKPHNK